MKVMKVNLTRPAFISIIAYIVMGFVILLPLNIGDYDPKYALTKKYNFGYRLLLLLLMLVPIALSVYSINCFVVGKCHYWAYINAVIVCVWVILFVSATVISSERFKNK